MVHAYAKKRSYYYIYGDKDIYVQAQLVDIMSLELNYSSPGSFDQYLSQFEKICDNMEACNQGLTESQKRTLSLNRSKYGDFKNLKCVFD